MVTGCELEPGEPYREFAMISTEVGIPFGILFAYTDYLAVRWFDYFATHKDALDMEVEPTSSLRDLVRHIVEAELFLAYRILGQEPPLKGSQSAEPEELLHIHVDADARIRDFLSRCDDEMLLNRQTNGETWVSNRKILAQAALHSVHHWAQVAMKIREGGFPIPKPQDFILSDLMP